MTPAPDNDRHGLSIANLAAQIQSVLCLISLDKTTLLIALGVAKTKTFNASDVKDVKKSSLKEKAL